MRHLRTLFLALCLLAMVAVPQPGAAQQRTETVTIQLSGRTPFGTSVVGTIVVRRTCAAVVTSDVVFNGTLNGLPARFSGKVIERWLGPGREEVEVLSTDIPSTVNYLPPVRTLTLTQTTPNLIFLDGIPIAIDGTLQEPCSGRLSYIVTNAGQAPSPILRLPNTAGVTAWLLHPYAITSGLFSLGLLLLGASRLLRKNSAS